MAGRQNSISSNGMGEPLTLAPRGTGSFTPLAITDTPNVSFQLIKATDKNSLEAIRGHTSNVSLDYQANGVHWPSGSANEYLWAVEDDLTADSAHSGSISGSLLSAPWTTGSAIGSRTYHVSGLNSKYLRVTIESRSGGTFRLVGFGKE